MQPHLLKRIGKILKWSVLIGVGLFIAAPLVATFATGFLKRPEARVELLEGFQGWWLKASVLFIAAWTFFLGSCLASFLNVVAWRLPQKMTLLGKSHCPACGTTLSLRENMPIIGWLECGGVSKCCFLPIPVRYFLVEILLGLMFLILAGLELGLSGTSLMGWLVEGHPMLRGFLEPQTFAILGGHLTLVCLLFTVSLMRFECNQVPLSIFIFGLFAAIATGLAAESLGSTPSNAIEFIVRLGLRITAGLAAAIILLAAERFFVGARYYDCAREIIFGVVLTSMFLGLNGLVVSVVGIAVLTIMLRLLGQYGEGCGWLAFAHRLLIATFLQLVFWQQFGNTKIDF